MSQPTFTFSPDGVQMFMFSPSAKMLKFLIAAAITLICCVATTLVGIALLIQHVLLFFLTANVESLARVLILLVVALVVALFYKFRTASFVKQPSFRSQYEVQDAPTA
jgi:hypothetical protein